MLVGGQDILGMYFVDSPVANCRQVEITISQINNYSKFSFDVCILDFNKGFQRAK